MAYREALRSETAEVVRRGQAGKGQSLDCGIEAGKASRHCPANWAISPFALISQISRGDSTPGHAGLGRPRVPTGRRQRPQRPPPGWDRRVGNFRSVAPIITVTGMK